MSSIDTLLTDPDAFFRARSDSPSLKGPAVVVALVAVVGAVAGVVEFRATAQLYEQAFAQASADAAGSLFQMIQVAGIAVGLVVPFVLWALYSGIFYGVSALFDGEGSFTRTLALAGWGFVPFLVGSVVQLLVSVYRFEIRGVEVPAEVTAQQFREQVASGPLVTVTSAQGLLFTLWAALLWTFAIKHARGLSTRDAAISMAVPVVVGVLWTAFNAVATL